ncbi:MAG: hypothetical protein H6812_02630 [Phycisphaeraceae bacterium]|nr:hypothetical protein [Phycisphaerales bacterium]MCB9842134.1 hypothetical protein [Phycisphaeraceae bacterium]
MRTPVRTSQRHAFTLIETALAVLIIGLGIVTIVSTQITFIRKNQWSTHTATGSLLASEIREMSRNFSRHDRFTGGLYTFTDGGTPTNAGWGCEVETPTVWDLDDLDDLDGVVFGDATDLPEDFELNHRFAGPINAFRQVINQTNWDGTITTVEVDGEVSEVSLRGWTQCVQVEKLDPYDYTIMVDNYEAGAGGADNRPMTGYPIRVTVIVLFQGEFDDEAREVSRVIWVVPPT